MTTQRIPTLTALVVLCLSLPALLSAGNPTHYSKRVAQTTLRVSNDIPQPVFVTLIAQRRDGWAQWPLGTIDASTARTFRLSSEVLSIPNIRIVATAFSNWKEYESKAMTLRSGRHLDLTLANPEPLSLLAAR